MVPEPRRAWVTWALLGAAVGCFIATIVLIILHHAQDYWTHHLA